MRVLLTGASGFLGTHLRAILRERYVIAALSTRKIGTPLFELQSEYDVDGIVRAIKDFAPQTIVHLAGVMKSQDETMFLKVNLNYAESILEAVEKSKVDPRVIIVGTAAEYGAPVAPGAPLKETDICKPTTAYGRSKLAQTEAAIAASERGIKTNILRIFNLAGAGQSDDFILGRVASHIRRVKSTPAEDGLEGSSLKTGSLGGYRDFVDVRTAAFAIKYVIDSDTFPSAEIFNICSGRPLQIRTAVQRALALSGLPKSIIHEAGNEPGNDVVFGDNAKWFKQTGLRIEFDLDSTISDMLR